MNYALSRPPVFRRSGLFGLVVGLHVAIYLLIVTARTIAPQIAEMPLIVDLLPAQETSKPPAAEPLPVSRPQPVRKTIPVKAATTPPPLPVPAPLETSSEAPAPFAPVVAPPAPPAPAPASSASADTAPSEARYDADYLRNPAPIYPPLSRRMGEEGKVVLRVQVSPSGTADSVEIRTSSGSRRLDETAQKTVRNWKFIPAKRAGMAVQSWVLVPIMFKLEQ